jgi:hypothetical protein
MTTQPLIIRFARECQIAAGHYLPPTDFLRILTATWSALAALPPVIPEATVARRVFHAVLQLAWHVYHNHSNTAERPVRVTPSPASYHRAVQSLNSLLVKYRSPGVSLNEVAQEVGIGGAHLSDVLRKA